MNTPVRVTTAAELGNALRSHRKKQQIRQRDLADYALLSPRFLSQFENGKETAAMCGADQGHLYLSQIMD